MSIPMAIKITPFADDYDPIGEKKYRSIVGTLQYLTFTSPNIQHVVNKAYFHSPTLIHLKAVKIILCYLNGKIEYGLRFLTQSHDSL